MDMRRYRLLAWASYGAAALLIIFPILDSILGVWPFHPEQITWRFGALGLFSRGVMTPTLGLLIGIVTAVLFEHRAWLRAQSVLSFVGAALLLTAVSVFFLDALQTRTQVVPDATASFNAASAVAVLKYGMGVLLCLALGAGGWVAARPGKVRGEGGTREDRVKGDSGGRKIVGSSRA